MQSLDKIDCPFEKEIGLPAAQLNPDSIRVVAYDVQGHARVHKPDKKKEERFYVPYRMSKIDSPSRLRISWRTSIEDVSRFAIYFSRKGSGLVKAIEEIPAVGDGDYLSFGRRGVVGPLSGGYNEIVAAADADLDGDQDLFVAYSGTTQKGGIFYYENIQDESRLCFHSGQRIYPLKEEFQPIDWDGDGDVDLMVGNSFQLLYFARVKTGLAQGVPLTTTKGKQPFSIYVRPYLADMDGDGDLDILMGGEDGRIECYHRAFIENDLPTVKILRVEKRGR